MTKIDYGVRCPADFSPVPDEFLEQSIIPRFDQIVETYPDRMAIKSQGCSLTYREMNHAINDLAHQIILNRGEDKSPVAFLFQDEVYSIITLLAVSKTGRVFSGLHPGSSVEQLRSYLQDSTAHLLITSSVFKPLVEKILDDRQQVKVYYYDEIKTITQYSNPVCRVHPGDPFAIFYTSGSTGKSKGVVSGHNYRSQMYYYMTNEWYFSPSDRISLVTSVCFAAAYPSLLCALLNGGLLCLYDLKANSAQSVLDWIVDEQLTVFRCTPTIFRTVFGQAQPGLAFSNLRLITLGGEPVTDNDIELFKSHTAEDCVLINNFSSAEAGTMCHFPVSHRTPPFHGFLPAGYPAPAKEILLLDPDGRTVTAGEEGEIAIRSRFLSLGYWRQPQLTAQKFHTDSKDPSVRIFFTGDRGRWRADGALEVLGRTDSQVKIRGFRVQLEAIDLALRNLDGVKDAATIVHQSPGRGERLVAYLSMLDREKFSASQLRKYLSAQLPDYMIPSAFVQMDVLPRTATGKLARLELPKTSSERPELETPYMTPRNKIEAQIASIWQKTLELDTVGLDDNFFELGGDSLMAMSLLFDIEKEFSRKMPLAIISKASTIKQQAEILRNEDALDAVPVLIPIQTNGDKKPIYCMGGKGGNPIRFHHLLKYLAEDQPVYFLRARGFDASERIESTIEAIASDYLLEIKKVQPTGPYYFLGESSGGLVAYEMAQQLQGQGQETAFVGMLDTYLSEMKGGQISSPVNLFMLLQKHVQTLTSGGITGIGTYLRYYTELWKFKASDARYERRKKKVLSQHGDVTRLYEKVEKANVGASRAYKPRPYPGRVVMFRADRQLKLEGNSPDDGWKEVGIGELDIHLLDCYHGNILFEPFVQQVAEKVNQYLSNPANASS